MSGCCCEDEMDGGWFILIIDSIPGAIILIVDICCCLQAKYLLTLTYVQHKWRIHCFDSNYGIKKVWISCQLEIFFLTTCTCNVVCIWCGFVSKIVRKLPFSIKLCLRRIKIQNKTKNCKIGFNIKSGKKMFQLWKRNIFSVSTFPWYKWKCIENNFEVHF